MTPAPQGTILPGTTIQLGRFTVVIDRYIAEGGFAHVYVGSIVNNGVIVPGFPVVIKRIAVADKERLAVVNSEIETMKRLGKHKNVVEYMDSCMGKLEHGGYEVLILMEYCGGGPVIDLMNRRLQHRLTEPEILKIFSNVCEAVAYLHYCDPPILHRDIKVENILLSNNDYKLCDFGSATTNILRGDNIPRNVKDIQLLEEEINNHTTLQYRAPEMLDLYMRKGIDEKIDIWALGVLLYKLCYYTTPFEEQGQLAILNARYTIPDHPVFSPALIGLFQSMLKEDPRQRPNIYQVMKMTSTLRGLPCPIQNVRCLHISASLFDTGCLCRRQLTAERTLVHLFF
ncbi:MAG: kinase-like domain-containing protein [Linnemannia elongata]|nr:MAG: kinase-like domain-containing protein [Linnemannia elongata]